MTPARKRDFIFLFINGFAPCVSKKLHQDHITTLPLVLTTEKAQGAIKLGILLMGTKKNSNSRSLEGVGEAKILTTPSEFVSVLSFISMLLQAKGNDGTTKFKYLYKYKDRAPCVSKEEEEY